MVSVGPIREVVTSRGPAEVADATLRDATGTVKLVLWGPQTTKVSALCPLGVPPRGTGLSQDPFPGLSVSEQSIGVLRSRRGNAFGSRVPGFRTCSREAPRLGPADAGNRSSRKSLWPRIFLLAVVLEALSPRTTAGRSSSPWAVRTRP